MMHRRKSAAPRFGSNAQTQVGAPIPALLGTVGRTGRGKLVGPNQGIRRRIIRGQIILYVQKVNL